MSIFSDQTIFRRLGETATYPSYSNVKIEPFNIFNAEPLTPPTTFPEEIEPPSGLPPRVVPPAPILSELDEVFHATAHPILGPRSIGGATDGYIEAEDETKSKAAMAVLEKHIADRRPYMLLATKQLQARIGIKNQNIFDLPRSPKIGTNSGYRALYSIPESRAPDAGYAANVMARSGGRKDSGIGLGFGLGPRTLGLDAVDKETGRGLREFLLQKGKEQGFKKIQCRGISFHDFTPDCRTLQHQNFLLGHYGADGIGERLDVYEVNLPTVIVDSETGIETQALEPWLWVLISRPIVSFDMNDRSTYVAPPSPELGTPASDSTTYYTPQSRTPRTESDTPSLPTPPPNFPYPLPTSWLVFAAPVAHLTVYPEQTENLPSTGSNASRSYPFAKSRKRNVMQKRRDYDFSHAGAPIFEFSSSTTLFTHGSPSLNFLSVDGIGPWSEHDAYAELTHEEYALADYRFNRNCEIERFLGISAAERQKVHLNRCGEYDSDDEAGATNFGAGVAAPNKGRWWQEFYSRMYADRSIWRGVRSAMARGKCRVVIRWVELEGGEDGLGRYDVAKAPLDRRDGPPPAKMKRLTHNDANRRSGLLLDHGGLVRGPASSGLGDSNRARAVGNTQLSSVRAKAKAKATKI